jgi:hypothetical protein
MNGPKQIMLQYLPGLLMAATNVEGVRQKTRMYKKLSQQRLGGN